MLASSNARLLQFRSREPSRERAGRVFAVGDVRATGFVRRNDRLDALLGDLLFRPEDVGGIGRRLACQLWQSLATAVMRVDLDVHRKADLQRVRRELLRIERNPDGNALNDLDPV